MLIIPRKSHSFSGDRSSKRTRREASGSLPYRARLLQRKAAEQNVNLLFMPKGMTRHDENTSYFDASKKKIFWKVKCTFVEDNGQKTVTVNENVSEDTSWRDCLLDRTTSPDVGFAQHKFSLAFPGL